jgi:hypothetical protein
MAGNINPSERGQLEQAIEMFEVITQSQPQDYQSLEILKEAFSKLGRDAEVIKTSKRIAEAYVQLGQLSSAILEYETILQRFPSDPDVQAALKAIESKATSFAWHVAPAETAAKAAPEPVKGTKTTKAAEKAPKYPAVEDGRQAMYKMFVESKIISAGDFDSCWSTPDPNAPPDGVVNPFLQIIADKGIAPLEKTLKVLADKLRLAYLPLEKYDIDVDLARTFPAEVCRRWCVMPFDRMSKTVMVATANPFNQQALRELTAATTSRVVWYLTPPGELIKVLQKVFH